MKNTLIIITIALLLASCKKDTEDKFLTFIKAGQTQGLGIKYVDFVPDEKMEWGYSIKYLDLNNDSINDFKLIYVDRPLMPSTYENYLTITPLEENSVCVSKNITSMNSPFVESLAFGDTIGTNKNWSNSNAYLFMYTKYCFTDDTGKLICREGSDGYWYDHDNSYMGVKIIKESKEFYGWIDVKMKGEAIRGYAVSVPY